MAGGSEDGSIAAEPEYNKTSRAKRMAIFPDLSMSGRYENI